MKRTGAAAALALLLLAGCGGGDQAPATAPSSPPAAPPTMTATTPPATSPAPDEGDPGLPTDEPVPLSKRAAAQRYLKLVKPANQAGERLDAAIRDRNLKKIRAAAKEYAKASRAVSIGLQETTWPYDVQEYTEQLADANTEEQLNAQDIAQAKSVQQAADLYEQFTGTGRKAAERIRQRLGLPAVG